MIGFDIDKIIKEFIDCFRQGYQEGLENSVKSSDFVFDFTDGLHCKCFKSQPRWILHG